MKWLFTVVVLIVAAATLTAQKNNNVPESANGEYGVVVEIDGTVHTLDEVIEGEMTEAPSQMEVEVTEVCLSMGCWMMVKSENHEIRVAMKDHSFFVPSSLIGKKVIVQGVLMKETVSEDMRKHYAEDAGATEEEIEKITGDSIEYTFEASGVKAE